MIDQFYGFLGRIGYAHPIHPPLTHIPMGLIIGAFFFALAAVVFRRNVLPMLAYRRIMFLALVFVIPTALFGYLDWQYFYSGDWSYQIKIKLALTAVLIVLLTISLFLGRNAESETKGHLIVFTLCFLTVTGLGYFGGDLVFGERAPGNVPIRFAVGEKVFTSNCITCHPREDEIINSPLLLDSNKFIAYLRNPSGGMPSFPTGQISDARAMRLYDYLVQSSGRVSAQ